MKWEAHLSPTHDGVRLVVYRHVSRDLTEFVTGLNEWGGLEITTAEPTPHLTTDEQDLTLLNVPFHERDVVYNVLHAILAVIDPPPSAIALERENEILRAQLSEAKTTIATFHDFLFDLVKERT